MVGCLDFAKWNEVMRMIFNGATRMDGLSISKYQQLNQVINYNPVAQPLSIFFLLFFSYMDDLYHFFHLIIDDYAKYSNYIVHWLHRFWSHDYARHGIILARETICCGR